MNRQIKFRGIATVNDKYNGIKVGDFVYGCFVETNIDCQILFGDGEQVSVDRNTVGQFTGLLDKNGVEIYEGDAVIAYSAGSKAVCEVKWGQGRVGFFLFHEKLHKCWSLSGGGVEYNQESCEVIGNLHQNKELLK